MQEPSKNPLVREVSETFSPSNNRRAVTTSSCSLAEESSSSFFLALSTFSLKFLYSGTCIADLALVHDCALFHDIELVGKFGTLKIHALQMFHGPADFLLQFLVELVS